MSALEAINLRKSFGGVQAVRDVSFELARGELLALIGPNGAGKSTCFSMLDGQVRPDAGSIVIGERNIVGRRADQICRLGVGRTFQITETFRSMSVRENVQMALISAAGKLSSWWQPAKSYFRGEADALLDRVGIADQAERPCAILSYGDLKRVELAIALANDPQILLMDEPTAGMAPRERIELMSLTRGIVNERGISVLFTEHDMDVVFANADRMIVLDRGVLIASGRPDEVRADATVQKVYLGSGRSTGQRAAKPC
jgi:branched-chain amino acid transport system ATP-binding protein